MSVAIDRLLRELSTDKSVFARCPCCDYRYSLARSAIFHANNIPAASRGFVEAKRAELAAAIDELEDLKRQLAAGHAARSFSVKLGTTFEHVVASLPDFPYVQADCKPFFKPVDYLAFVGLASRSVQCLDFVEVKTGRAQLSKRERSIRDVVESGRVFFEAIA
ncbi:MAG: Holliday junction resolvase-like protein [Thermoplasmatota archaeon]